MTDDAKADVLTTLDDGPLPGLSALRTIAGPVETRDQSVLEYFAGSGLPLSSIMLGLFDQSEDCIKLIDPSGGLQFMNCNGQQAMEIDDFSELVGCGWSELWPERSRALVNEAIGAAMTGQVSRFEAFCPTAKGTPKWWEVTVSPIHGEHGEVAAILSSSRDITVRKQQEEQLSTMALEMRHRLRNSYAISAALVRLLGRDDPRTREFSVMMADRYLQLSEVQSALLDVGVVRLDAVVDRIMAVFGMPAAIEKVSIPPVELDEKQARAIVVVLGEMATNSLKYGALSGRGRMALMATHTDGTLQIDWRETLTAASAEHTATSRGGGSGRVLKERMLATVNGGLEVEVSEHSYVAKITLPLAQR